MYIHIFHWIQFKYYQCIFPCMIVSLYHMMSHLDNVHVHVQIVCSLIPGLQKRALQQVFLLFAIFPYTSNSFFIPFQLCNIYTRTGTFKIIPYWFFCMHRMMQDMLPLAER